MKRRMIPKLTDLAWWPADAILIRIHAIHHQLATSPAIMDRILQDLDAARRLNHDIESVRVFGFDLLEHGFRVRAAEGDVLVRRVEALSQIDLETLRRGDDDVAPTVLT